MKKKTNINNIFNTNLNKDSKSILFNTRSSDTGEIKYLPPVSKEWKSTIYSYYKNNMQNLPVYDSNTNKIIRCYFDLHFKTHKFTDSKYIGMKKRRNLLRKIYTSKIETKHTNSNMIITLYTINIGKSLLYKNYKLFSRYINKKVLNFWRKKLSEKLTKTNLIINETKNDLALSNLKSSDNKKEIFTFKYKLLNESLTWYNLYLKLYLCRAMKYSYYKKLRLLRKYQYNYYLNKFKFENTGFLQNLSNMLYKIYNKKIEFNIINLKTISFNPEIFTEALALKLKRQQSSLLKVLNSILKRASLPNVNRIMEKGSIIKSKNPLLVENKYKNLSLLSIMNDNSLEEILKESTDYTTKSIRLNTNTEKVLDKDYNNISKLLFNSIKYKNMGGIRLEVKGRLTKRYRADRSVFKLNWKGGLKNIDSSYKGLSTTTYRGYYKPNIASTVNNSKRRVGSFAVKGWLSGK